jgi:uncharacterized membrane protein YccC
MASNLTPLPHDQDTRQAALTASATAVCLILAEWFELEHANQAVWTTFLVLVSFPHTQFQKGVERVVGRGVGILLGLLLATLVSDAALLALFLIFVFLVASFYIYFSGRLSYTALNAGLYLVAVFDIGHADPTGAITQAQGLFLAVLLGVVVADLVAWITASEQDLGIQVGGKPLLPLNLNWLNQSVMLVLTVVITLFVSHAIGLSPGTAAVSVMVLTVSPHLQALILKGELRVVGVALGSAWSLLTFFLVSLMPYLPLLVVLIFLGEFIAAYLARTAGKYSYAGLQMGIVLPMVAVAPPSEFGSFAPALGRLEGVLVGMAASVVVGGLWLTFPLAEAPPPPPPPNEIPGEMDV